MQAEEVFRRFDVSRESQARLRFYAEVLQTWQPRINLISEASTKALWDRHIADSLQLRLYIGGGEQTIVDIGSGAGLPGLVLALAFPEYRVTLIESNGKKAAFLREVARQARISAKIVQKRIEHVDSDAFRYSKPIITARAVAPLPKLLGLAAPLTTMGRALFHKGQEAGGELTEAMKSWNIEYIRHPSMIDPRGVILEVLEVRHIDDYNRGGV